MAQIIINGDITTAESGIIVHCCNAQGVMGSGVAGAIRTKWPGVFTAYRDAYRHASNFLALGDVHYAWVPSASGDLFVANLIGQEYYGGEKDIRYVDYDAIRKGFKSVVSLVRLSSAPTMIHYPQLGAGLAGGDWNIIQTIINEEVGELDHTLWMFGN